MAENNSRLASPAMTRFCLVPARQTGIASLCIQLIALVTSAALTILLLLHLSGTSLARTIKQHTHLTTTTTTTETTITITPVGQMTPAIYNTTMLIRTEDAETATNLSMKGIWNHSTFFNATESGAFMFGQYGPQLDLLELLHISTVVYIGMTILWLLSLMSLLASIKLESLDLIIMNSVLLTIVMIYVIIHALFTCILYVYYKYASWTTLIITSAVVLGLALTSITCGFALAFNVIWYRYVVYVNDNDQCQCLSAIAHMFKRHRKRQPAHEYSIPEVTRHPNLPYNDEVAVQNFSRL